MVNHFARNAFDLLDLSDLICTWCIGLFASSNFPVEFIARTIDVVLLEGPQVLIIIVYALLVVCTSVIMQAGVHDEEDEKSQHNHESVDSLEQDSTSLFKQLSDLPSTLTRGQINEIFKLAYQTYRGHEVDETNSNKLNQSYPFRTSKMDQIQAIREQKDWLKLMEIPGAVSFHTSHQDKMSYNANHVANSKSDITRSTHSQNETDPSLQTQPTPTMVFNLSDYTQDNDQKLSNSTANEHHQTSTSIPSLTQSLAAVTLGVAAAGVVSGIQTTQTQKPGVTNSTSNTSPSTSKHSSPNKTSIQSTTSALPPITSASSASNSSTVTSTSNLTRVDHQLLSQLAAVSSNNEKLNESQLRTLIQKAEAELKRLSSMDGALDNQENQNTSTNNNLANSQATSTSLLSATTTASSSVSSSSALATTSSSSASSSDSLTTSDVYELQSSFSRAVGASKKPVPASGIIKYSEILEYLNFPCVTMKGYLMKSRAPSKLFKRSGSSGFFGNLSRRYFYLSGPFLTYFKSQNYSKPTRDIAIDIRKCKVVKLKTHHYAPFAFEIYTRPNMTNTITSAVHDQTTTPSDGENRQLLYTLFADNESVREIWLELLTQATNMPLS